MEWLMEEGCWRYSEKGELWQLRWIISVSHVWYVHVCVRTTFLLVTSSCVCVAGEVPSISLSLTIIYPPICHLYTNVFLFSFSY